MKTKKAIELILMPKVFYTFKELTVKISILFSFLSKYWKLQNKPYYLAYARTVISWLNSRAWFLIVGQNFEVKLMPNERSRFILKGSRFKPLGIFPSADQRQSEFGFYINHNTLKFQLPFRSIFSRFSKHSTFSE